MIGFIQKIILSLLTLAVAGFLVFFIMTMLVDEPSVRQDPLFLIPVVLCLLSLSSTVFNLKTISLHKDNSQILSAFSKNAFLWYLNLAFGIAVILVAFLIVFQISQLYDRNIQSDYFIQLIIIVFTLLYGSWICLDYYLLMKKVKEQKSKSYINQIDEISGRNQKD